MDQQTAVRVGEQPTLHEALPFDLDFLAAQTLGDPGLEQEVLRMFDQMSRVYFGRLETSTTVADLLLHLHTIKGAAAGVGALRLADLARTMESELRSGLPVNPKRVDEIEIAVREVSAFIAERLRDAVA